MIAVLLGSADQSIVAHWQKSLGDGYSIECSESLDAILEQCKNKHFALVVFDYALLEEDFPACLPRIQQDTHQAKILLIGKNCSRETQIQAFGQGIPGYMESDVSADLIVKGVDRILRGEVWLERQMVSELLETLREYNDVAGEISTPENLSSLTPRELEIAKQICQGESNKRIAMHLDITERTVKAHLSSIFKKLEVADRLQLAIQLKDCFSK